MITIASAKECKNPAELLNRAARVAQFYGFIPMEQAPSVEKGILGTRTNKIDMQTLSFVRKDERALVSAAKQYVPKGLGDRRQSALLFRLVPADRGTSTALELHVVGIPDAIAEGLLISVSDAVAAEAGIEKRIVHINSIGGLDSSSRYMRDVGAYLRRHHEDLPQPIQERILENPIAALLELSQKGHPALTRAPISMDYLNEEERKHFWDVLEHLELADTYYELNPHVLGSRDFWAHTLFEVLRVDPDTGEKIPFARGGRYDSLVGKFVGSGASAVSVSIALDTKTPDTLKQSKLSPSVYFAHLGKEARRRAIPALEILRRAGIPVHQTIAYEQLAPQMLEAKRLKSPYLLIMGHKEAVEGTMLVRDVRTNFQDAVSLPDLPTYLRRHRIGVAA
jgi:histidyl-tRNA synthetase